MLEYAKGIVAVIGAGVVAALELIPPHTATWNWLTIAAAVITAIGVYRVPNAKP